MSEVSVSTALISPLSQQELDEIDHEISHAPSRPAVAIDALKIVQKYRGWVSDESLAALARHLEMSASELDSVATFYNHIYRKPVGDNIVLLCNSVSCWVMGCGGLQRQIEDVLQVPPGGTTADNQCTFIPVPCLGACDKAPVLMVNETLYENVAPDDLEGLLVDASTKSQEGRDG
ncbi:MAG: NADH-quinone oxidoreductase subunit NuoE [bacterium]